MLEMMRGFVKKKVRGGLGPGRKIYETGNP
jgi:hypothetical protein